MKKRCCNCTHWTPYDVGGPHVNVGPYCAALQDWLDWDIECPRGSQWIETPPDFSCSLWEKRPLDIPAAGV